MATNSNKSQTSYSKDNSNTNRPDRDCKPNGNQGRKTTSISKQQQLTKAKRPTKDQISQVECLNINDEETNTSLPDLEQQREPNQRTNETTSANRSQVSSSSGLATNEDAPQSQMMSCQLNSQQSRDINETYLSNRPDPETNRNTVPTTISQQLNKNLIFATLISAMGSAFQHGYNGGVVNAPEKLIAQFINETKHLNPLDPSDDPVDEAELDFVFSLIVSFFCIGGFVGALLTAVVADRLGRREGLFYNCLLVLLACPLMASARSFHSYKLLILGRFIIGVNAGLNAGLAPLYLNEIAPIGLRGAFGTMYQLILTMSILISNLLGLPNLLGSSELWPFLFLFPILPAGLMMASLPHCRESPKFLLLVQGRELQAQQSLAWFRGTADGIQEEMEDLRMELERSKLLPAVTLTQLWRQSALRKPMTISIVIMLSQQLSGINAILFYSTSIFRDAGLSQESALHATLGMSIVNVLMTGLSLVLVDRAGRKTLHMTGLLGMAISCCVLALCLGPNASSLISNQHPGSPASLLAVLSTYTFIVMFASGPGSIPWFLVGELFPSNARPLASSIAVAVNWLANFTVSLCFLPLTNVLHGYTFFIFASLLLLFYLFTYFKVPETKGASAEEISALFVR